MCSGCLYLWSTRALLAVLMRNPSLHRYVSLERLFHMSPWKPFRFVTWDVDSSCRLACAPAGGSAAHETPPHQGQFQQHGALTCTLIRSLLGTFPIPRQYLSASPVTNWILEVSTHCSWISGISCGNLKALDIFKCSHQMNHNINYSAD